MNITSMIFICGLKLPLMKFFDKLSNGDISSSYVYKMLQKANPREYPRLLKGLYYINTGLELNLDEPVLFNEKIQWMKIYDFASLKTELADKYLVREWVDERIGKAYLTNLFGVWNSFDEIDFDKLPNAFFLKCNHGSGFNFPVKDKNLIDKYAVKRQFDEWMNYNFAYRCLEMQYRDIVPRIIAEEFIEQENGNLMDYKIHVFNGEPRLIQIIGNRNLSKHTAREILLTTEWGKLNPGHHDYPEYNYIPDKPSNLDEMLDIAHILGEGFRYVRVDLYDLDGQIRFGEMTFTPCAGYEPWNHDFQELLGSWIDLS